MPQPQREQRLRDADAHLAAGRVQEAADLYQALIQSDPCDAVALHRLGALALEVGQEQAAVQILTRALELKREDAEAWFDFGRALLACQEPGRAEAAFVSALRLRADYPEARHNLGVALARLGRTQEAIDAWRAVVEQRPDDVAALANLGRALLDEKNRPELALPYLSRRLALEPEPPEALLMVAEAARRAGRADEALDAYERLARVTPDATCLGLLGSAQVQAGMLAEGIASIRRAVAMDPAALATRSDLLLALHYHPALDPREIYEEHLSWAAALRAERGDLARASPPRQTENRDPHRRLRIGYVSPDFREHAAESFIRPLLAAHDHEAFEVICYHTHHQSDAATARFRSWADVWRDVAAMEDDALERQIRADGIDVLVDLAGHTAGNRLAVFARRPAPVQVTCLGYCDTTGLGEIDYRLTDAICDPPGEPRRHTEELVRLPGGFSCFAAPDLPPVAPDPPAARHGHITFGSTHGLAKLNDRVLDVWAELLRAAPGARLLVCRHDLTGRARQRLLERFVDRGVAADRLELRSDLPGGRWLEAYNDIDVLLDVFPWSGHTTCCEALCMGVPVVTLSGVAHAGRMAASVLTHAGLGEWVATSPGQYVEIASKLAGDVGRLRDLRLNLRDRFTRSRATDGPAAAREIERVYRQMWQRWCDGSAGVPPGRSALS